MTNMTRAEWDRRFAAQSNLDNDPTKVKLNADEHMVGFWGFERIRIKCEGKTTVVYVKDQWERIENAKRKGQRFILFDDIYSVTGGRIGSGDEDLRLAARRYMVETRLITSITRLVENCHYGTIEPMKFDKD